MMAKARLRNDSWMSSRISHRIHSRRNQCSSAIDCSTIQRCMPSPEPCSVPRRAITGVMPGPDLPTVLVVVIVPVGVDRICRCLGPRRHPADAADRRIAAISGISWVTSLRWPPVSDIGSGIPCASVITWCLEPVRARSTGIGPVLGHHPQWLLALPHGPLNHHMATTIPTRHSVRSSKTETGIPSPCAASR